MRKLLTILVALVPSLAFAQAPVNLVETNLSATRPLPAQLSNGSSFIVPVLDTTLTARFPAGSTPADNESNAVTITRSGVFMFAWDGTDWDRLVQYNYGQNVGAPRGPLAMTMTASGNTVGPMYSDALGYLMVAQRNGSIGDYDTGAPFGDQVMFGLALPGAGGAVPGGTSAAPLRIDPTGTTTQPVSGTVDVGSILNTPVPVSQSGTWNLNNVTGAVSLPTGAATSANQSTAITALQLIDNLPLAQGSTTSGQSGVLAQGAVTTSAPSYTTGQTSPLSLTTSGELRVAGSFSGGGDGAIQDGATPSIEASVLDYTNSNPLAVRLTDTNGDYVGAGAGTQYQDGDAQATPTGTVALGHDGSNVRALTTDASGDLQIDILTMPAVDTELPTPSIPADSEANIVSVPRVGGFGFVWNGGQWDRMRGDATTGVAVDQYATAQADYDSGAGTVGNTMMGLALPGPGGPVAGGTSSDPVRVDPTGSTTQPVSVLSLPIQGEDLSGSITSTQSVTTTTLVDIGSINVQISGTWTGTIVFESNVDFSNWTAHPVVDRASGNVVTQTTGNGIFATHAAALSQFRARGNTVSSGSASVNLVSGPRGPVLITQPVSGTVTANAGSGSFTVAQATAANLNATITDGAGPLTVDGTVAATQSGTWNVNVGTFPDNEPVNVAQMNGVAVTMGNGAAGSGVQRVTIASDSTGQVAIASLPNEGQQTMTNSVSVAVASDQSALQVKGQNSVTPIYCTSTAFLNMTTATTTQLVALSGSTVIYVCSYAFHVGGASDVKLVRGTGTNCGTGTADITPTYDFAAADAGINRVAGGGNIVAQGTSGNAVCATSSAAVDVDVEVSYAQF